MASVAVPQTSATSAVEQPAAQPPAYPAVGKVIETVGAVLSTVTDGARPVGVHHRLHAVVATASAVTVCARP